MGRRATRNITKSVSCTNTLARTKIADINDVPRQGNIERVIFYISSIAGGATKFSKLTLGFKNEDGRYILPVATGTWEVDAADATKATLILEVNKEFAIDDTQHAATTDYSGWWLGVQLDAGTATSETILVVSN